MSYERQTGNGCQTLKWKKTLKSETSIEILTPESEISKKYHFQWKLCFFLRWEKDIEIYVTKISIYDPDCKWQGQNNQRKSQRKRVGQLEERRSVWLSNWCTRLESVPKYALLEKSAEETYLVLDTLRYFLLFLWTLVGVSSQTCICLSYFEGCVPDRVRGKIGEPHI